MKRCGACGESKPLTEFHRNRAQADGYAGSCKPCRAAEKRTFYFKHKVREDERIARWRRANPERMRARRRARGPQNVQRVRDWREANPEKYLTQQLVRYKITAAQYAEMEEAQDGRCAVCGTRPTKKRLTVDHDHVTGLVRGLLCDNCNRAAGLLGDNPETVHNMGRYLLGALHDVFI